MSDKQREEKSKDRLLKARATMDANKAKYNAQVIEIDKDWRIVRADELNWEVQHKGKFNGYFATLIAAFQSLPGKMLSESAKRSIGDVQESQRAINSTIESALSLKLAA